MGDRAEFLTRARGLLADRLGREVYASAAVETAAWGPVAQADYLNQVIQLHIPGDLYGRPLRPELHRILDLTQAIEHDLGRVRAERWGPRTIDIDLIFLDDLVYEDERISLPHPWWYERSFVRDLLPPGSLDPHGRILDTR